MIISPFFSSPNTSTQEPFGKMGVYLEMIAKRPSKDWNLPWIETMITMGLSPDKKNSLNETILHYFVSLFETYDDNFWEVIIVFLKMKVNPYKMNVQGFTAEDFLLKGTSDEERLTLSKKWAEVIKSYSPFEPKIEFTKSDLNKLACKIALYCMDYFLNKSPAFAELQIERYMNLFAEKCPLRPLYRK